jgi:hypothetical protein
MTLQRDQWERTSVTSGPCKRIPTHHCHNRSCKNNAFEKVDREEEGLRSNRPELVALRECLEAHEDHVDLLYLTDSEASLQAIHKWIGCGAKPNLSKSPDADILKVIILKLKKEWKQGQQLC